MRKEKPCCVLETRGQLPWCPYIHRHAYVQPCRVQRLGLETFTKGNKKFHRAYFDILVTKTSSPTVCPIWKSNSGNEKPIFWRGKNWQPKELYLGIYTWKVFEVKCSNWVGKYCQCNLHCVTNNKIYFNKTISDNKF